MFLCSCLINSQLRYEFQYVFLPRVSDPRPGIWAWGTMPGILKPGLGSPNSCSRSAKWAWDRPEGGCHRQDLESRNLCLHTSLVRTDIGSLRESLVTLRRKSRETNLGWIQSTHFTTYFIVLSGGCLSKATCSLFPGTDFVSVSGTGAVYCGQQPGHDGIVGALTSTILVD